MSHGEQHLCLKCRGVELPAERLNEGHVAVRFDQAESKRGEDWDTYRARTTGKHSAYGYRAYLNGVEVSNDCTEAVAGTDGWVVLFDSPRQLCATCHGVFSWVDRCDVRL